MATRPRRIRFTLFAYGALWFLGAVFGALAVNIFIIGENENTPLEPFQLVVLWGCFVAVMCHQIYVYWSIHQIEEGNFMPDSTRFLNSRREIVIRGLIFIALLIIGGKIDWLLQGILARSWGPQYTFAVGLVIFFFLLLVWDWVGLIIDCEDKPNHDGKEKGCVPQGWPVLGLLRLPFVAIWRWIRDIRWAGFRALLASNKFSRTWIIFSDLLGFLVSVSLLLTVWNLSRIGNLNWLAFIIGFYFLVIGLRILPTGSISAADSHRSATGGK